MAAHPENEPGAGMLVRAPFHDGSEVQTGRMLNVALQQDLRNGARVARALLEAVEDGPQAGVVAGLLSTMPSELRAWTEVPLHDLRIGQAQRHDKQVGWVDLVLQDPEGDWVLAVELKVNARYHADQLETYSALGIPLVGLVKVPGAAGSAARPLGSGWLGEATWAQIRVSLYALEWPLGGRAIWVEFLDTLFGARAGRDWADDERLADELLRNLLPLASARLGELLSNHRPEQLEPTELHHDVLVDEHENGSAVGVGAIGPISNVDAAPFALGLALAVEGGRLSHIVAVWDADRDPETSTTARPYERYVVGAMTSEKALMVPITYPEVRRLGARDAALRALEPILRVTATDLWGR